MELLNRDMQRQLLAELSKAYPSGLNMQRGFRSYDPREVQYNLFYLSEHGLVDVKATKLLSGEYPIHSATITARGIDFITDDGGLSAVLGVITVKLHEDTLKTLLIGKVESSDGDSTAKKLLIEKIKGMPAEALSTLTERALDSGLDQLPDLLGSLSKWLGL